jgi:hypothetical protein
MTTRPRLVRAFAAALEREHGIRFNAEHDTGATWTLEWGNGPTTAAVDAAAAKADLGGATLRYHRGFGQKALAFTAVRLARAGQFNPGAGGWGRADTRVEDAMLDIEHPQRPDDDVHERLADTLIELGKTAAADAGQPWNTDRYVAELLSRHGLAWLYEQAHLPASPLQILTARYVHGAGHQQQMTWIYQGLTIPAAQLIAAALADDQPPGLEVAQALVDLIPALREDLARTEARLHEILAAADSTPPA